MFNLLKILYFIVSGVTSTVIINETVTEAKVNAAKAAANNVIAGIEINEQLAEFNGTGGINNVSVVTTITVNEGGKRKTVEKVTDVEAIRNLISGEVPTTIDITMDGPKVSNGCMIISEYVVTIVNGEADSVKILDDDTTCPTTGNNN